MNEKYGIELQAIVNKFKTSMKATANFVKGLAKEMQEDVTFQPDFTISPDLTKKQLQKFKDELEREISNLKSQLEFEKNITPEQRKGSEGFYANPKKLQEYEYALSEINKRLEDTNKTSIRTDSGLGEAFKKGIANIKRFSFYLLGARSVFSLFMKYQSIYYQYNQQMQYQSELSQNAIALSLAPAFELLGNVIAYASIGFARFIELLTGVNVLSKVSTKGIRDYNKSLKETQTLVAGVDEITNLTTPNTTGLAGQYQALADFREKIDEVKKAFEKWKVEELTNKLKEIWEWIVKNKDELKYLAIGFATTFGIAKLGLWVANINQVIGVAGVGASAGTGLAGIASLCTYLVGIGAIALTVTFTVKFIDELKEYNEQSEILEEKQKQLAEARLKSLQEALNIMSNFAPETEEYKQALDVANTNWELINKEIATGSKEYDNQLDTIYDMGKELENLTKKEYTADVEVALKEAKNGFWTSMAKKAYKVTSILGDLYSGRPIDAGNVSKKIASLFGYEKGLDYVPYDEYPALLHKGEAVVPAKYNPAIHSAGNDYTNSLLETLVLKMDDLASRPNVFEVDGQKFATATYGLYKNQENRQNYNANVVVR